MPLKIINVVGARPNFMKMAPICRAFEAFKRAAPNRNIQTLLIHTGQHYDKNMSKVFFDGYVDCLHLITHAKFVITDSGGIQEETTVLGIPCLTIRNNTERPVTITEGTNILVGTGINKLISEANKILSGQTRKGKVPDKWDGKAAGRLVKILIQTLEPIYWKRFPAAP